VLHVPDASSAVNIQTHPKVDELHTLEALISVQLVGGGGGVSHLPLFHWHVEFELHCEALTYVSHFNSDFGVHFPVFPSTFNIQIQPNSEEEQFVSSVIASQVAGGVTDDEHFPLPHLHLASIVHCWELRYVPHSTSAFPVHVPASPSAVYIHTHAKLEDEHVSISVISAHVVGGSGVGVSSFSFEMNLLF
jgi:hypothetical protein